MKRDTNPKELTMTTRTTPETMSAVRDILRFFGRATLIHERREYRAERAVDITVCESHLRILGHAYPAIRAAEEYVISCARLPRERRSVVPRTELLTTITSDAATRHGSWSRRSTD